MINYFKKIIFLLFTLILNNQAMAGDINKNLSPSQQPTPSLSREYTAVKNAEISEIAKESNIIAINHAKNSLGIILDSSEKSIQQVETIISKFESQKTENITGKEIYRIGVIYGSYIGEVYIKHYGGKWVMITSNNHRFPGIEGIDGSLFWPWNRVVSRISEGSNYNLWDYYQSIIPNAQKNKKH